MTREREIEEEAMSGSRRLVLVVLLCVAVFAVAGVALAQTAEAYPAAVVSASAGRATPAPKVYPKLEASFSVYNWRKSDTPRDMIGTMTVYATGGNGRYTYEFIGLHTANTFDFRWRAGTVLVNSLRVWSGDGQTIDVPVWIEDVPCPKRWRQEREE
jgi:hypothetical protein